MRRNDESASAKPKITIVASTPVLNDARIRKSIDALALLDPAMSVVGIDGYGSLETSKSSNLDQKIANSTRIVRPLMLVPLVKKLAIIAGLLFLSLYLLGAIWGVISFKVLIFPTLIVAMLFALRWTFLDFYLAVHLVIAGRLRDAEILYCHDVPAFLAGHLIKQSQQKIIWDSHELYTELSYRPWLYRAILHQILKSVGGRTDGFVVVTGSMAAYYKAKIKTLPDGIVIKNSVVSNRSPLPAENKLREAAGLPDETKICLFQGGLEKGRGIEESLKAIEICKSDWALIFMGDGELSELVRDAAERLDNVFLIPPVPWDDLVHWTSGADLGLILYKPLSMNFLVSGPNKLWEYPNAGVPVLSTDLPEAKSLITRYGNGRLVSQNLDPVEVAKTLDGLEPADLQDMKLACLDFMQHEDWRKYEQKLRNYVATKSSC